MALDNRTGEVRAMVGGRPGSNYNEAPFNLATQGQRQPGSAFKVFMLAQALREGISPDSTWASHKKFFDVPGSAGQEKFVVENYEDQYAGVASLASATDQSDNSVYAEVGIKVGTRDIASMARDMGITTPISTNPAITLGGLEQGVTPLDMAHAYQTLAAGGRRISGTLAPEGSGPVGIRGCASRARRPADRRQPHDHPQGACPRSSPTWRPSMLEVGGRAAAPAKAAATGGFAAGKTGTTENYGDAWFVGFNERCTVAVWVGYPDRLRPMETEYQRRARWRAAPSRPRSGATFMPGRDAILDAARGRAGRPRRPRVHAAGPRPRRRRTAPVDRHRSDGRRARRRRPQRRAGGARLRAAAGERRRPAAAAARPRPRRPPHRPPSGGGRSGGGTGRRAAPARRRRLAGPGRDRAAAAATRTRLSAAQKRHGSSTALVMPIRGPATTSTARPAGAAGAMRTGPRARSRAVELQADAERLGQLARARAEVLGALEAAPRAHRARRPSSGSSARISTAAPTPSGSATALSRAWMP